MADEPAPLLYVDSINPRQFICLFCHKALTRNPVGCPAAGSQCWHCGKTPEQIAEAIRDEQRRAELGRERLKTELRALARNHLKPQIIKLLQRSFEPSLLPPDHLPSCPVDPPNRPTEGPRKPCNCAAERFDKHPDWERSGYNLMLRDSDVKPTLNYEWQRLSDHRQRTGKPPTIETINRIANRILERIFQVYYSGLDDPALDLGLDQGIGHRTTRRLEGMTAFQQRAEELLGSEPIEVEPRDHFTDEPNGLVTNTMSLGFLCWAWQHACAVGRLADYAPAYSVYRPVGNSRRANKASLILRILEELGRHTTAKRHGWVRVSTAAICDALGVPRNNPRYTQARKLLIALGKLRIVWDSRSTRNRTFRLLAYARPKSVTNRK